MCLCAFLVAGIQFWGASWRHSLHWDGELKIVEVPIPTHSELATIKAEEAHGGWAKSVWDGAGVHPPKLSPEPSGGSGK